VNSRHAFLVAAISASVGGLTWSLAGKSSPPVPAPKQNPPASGDNGGNNSSGNSSSSTPSTGNSNTKYPYGYPYNPWTGVPYTGIYTPGMAGSNPTPGSSGGTPGTSTTPTTNPSAPSLFPPDAGTTPTPAPNIVPSTPAPPPDPEITAATAALDDAVAAVKRSLKSNSDYMAAMSAKQAAKEEAAAYREKGDGAVPGDLVSIAQRGLDAGTKMTAIEREAMAKDPNVVAARARLDAAIKAHNAAK